jgi:hypothetical protein
MWRMRWNAAGRDEEIKGTLLFAVAHILGAQFIVLPEAFNEKI